MPRGPPLLATAATATMGAPRSLPPHIHHTTRVARVGGAGCACTHGPKPTREAFPPPQKKLIHLYTCKPCTVCSTVPHKPY